MVTIAVAAAGFAGLDYALQPWFQKFGFYFWEWFEVLGWWKLLAAMSFAAFFCAKTVRWISGRKIFIEKLSANIFCSVILAEGFVTVLRLCVGRAAPPLEMFSPFSANLMSFPSCHTAAAFAALVSVGLRHPKAKAFTWTLAIAAGLGRICMGAHYFSDVFAGAFLGMLSADLIVLARWRITALIK